MIGVLALKCVDPAAPVHNGSKLALYVTPVSPSLVIAVHQVNIVLDCRGRDCIKVLDQPRDR